MSAASLKNRLARLEDSTGTVYSLADLPALIQRMSYIDLEDDVTGSPALRDAKRRLRELTARLADSQT